jgi:gamma-glutamylcyclotransferase (GGCT)/AIG2-like uncharacterized protein YtfP
MMTNVDDQQTEFLFSYGTLQSEAVQLATLGRKVEGRPDALTGYCMVMIEITDHDFVATSGTAYHRNLQFTGDASDVVEGTVLSLTSQQLELSDSYEPAGYELIQVQLRSGLTAWVYVNNGQC